MYTFDDTAAVTAVLDRMAAREEPLVAQMARQPGARESRWSHLLGGGMENLQLAGEKALDASTTEMAFQDRIAALERVVKALEERMQALEQPRD
jgi:uncharacterized protein YceH (UPF0502 family)